MIYFSTIILYTAYLCDSITDDSTGGSLEKLSTQTIWSGPTVSRSPWNTWRSPNAVMQGRRLSKIFNTVGSKSSCNVVVMAQAQGNFLLCNRCSL
jgi:hypothetical protein